MIRQATDALACYRLTKLVLDDRITQPLRERWFARHPPESTALGYLATCPWCLSLWAGLGIVGARRLAPRAWSPLADVLAMSAVTGLLAEREP